MTGLLDDLQAVWDRYLAAYRQGDAAGCAACFTLEAAVYSPYGPPAIGRAAIAEQHGDWVKLGGTGKTLIIEQAGGSGDLAWCLSRYSEGGVTGNGTSLTVFERQAGGTWLARISSLNEV